MSLKIGVVGATGMVGEAFMHVLSRKNNFKSEISEVRPFASDKSIGTKVSCIGKEWSVQGLKEGCFKGLDLVFFSSGDDISLEWAPRAVDEGAFAVDNSAAFRMNPENQLIVPEVNGHLIPPRTKPALIANPNCSTIQLVVALKPLKALGINNVRVASYQSVSGAGKAGRDELVAQLKSFIAQLEAGDSKKDVTFYDKLLNEKPDNVQTFPHAIGFNTIPQIGSFNSEGFSSEEVKVMKETKKILEMPSLKVSAFTVRVPSLNSHSEAVWVTFDREVSRAEIVKAFNGAEGLKYIEQTSPSDYPTSRMSSGTDPVYVGRLHQDSEDKKTWLMWIVADNILKGAALNGLQIAQKIFN
jgi:aspartate-semialdehyde dehydrogenase